MLSLSLAATRMDGISGERIRGKAFMLDIQGGRTEMVHLQRRDRECISGRMLRAGRRSRGRPKRRLVYEGRSCRRLGSMVPDDWLWTSDRQSSLIVTCDNVL